MSSPTDRTQTLSSVANYVERCFDKGVIEWINCEIPQSTTNYVNCMLGKITYEVARYKKGFCGVVILKINDPLIGFLLHDPLSAKHLWIDKSYKNCLDNSAVFDYLMARKFNKTHVRSSSSQFPFAKKLKRQRFVELRSYANPKRLIGKGDVSFITSRMRKNGYVLGVTHFLVPLGDDLEPFTNRSAQSP